MAAPTFRGRGAGVLFTSTSTVPLPPSAVAGDLAICYVFSRAAPSGSTAAPWTVSRGSRTWVQVADSGRSTLRGAAFMIVLTAGDVTAGTVTVHTSIATAAAISAYNGGVGVEVSAGKNSGGSSFTSYEAPTLLIGRDNVLVVEAWASTTTTAALSVPANVEMADYGFSSTWPAYGVSDQSQPIPGSSVPESATDPASRWAAFTMSVYGTGAPLAPYLLDPAPNSYQSLDLGYTVDWTFNSDTDPATTQTAYALRRKVVGAGSYEYWNAGTSAWQGTIVWNSSTSSSAMFPAGKWVNGATYQWSVATQDVLGQGTFASDSLVKVSDPPTATVTSPVGAITGQLSVTWTETLQTGATQTAYRVVVESGAFGSSPGSGTAAYDSGVVPSLDLTAVASVALDNSTSFRVFVQVTQTGGQVSNWATSDFTTDYDEPAAPTVTSTWDADNARFIVKAQGYDNVLTANESSFEGGFGRWNPVRCTRATSTAWASDRTHSLALTASGAVGTTAEITMPNSVFPVIPGSTWSGLAEFHAATTSRSVGLRLDWYTAGGSLVSSTTATQPADTSVVVHGTAPSTAAYVVLAPFVTNPANGEIHYVDKVSLVPANTSTWTLGGFAGTNIFKVEASEDGGATWTTVRGAEAATVPVLSVVFGIPRVVDDTFAVYDYERTPQSEPIYRVRVTDATGVFTTLSGTTLPVQAWQPDWWIKDVYDATHNMTLCDAQQNIRTRKGDSTAVYPAGRVNPIVLRGPVHGAAGSFRTIVKTEADRTSALALFEAQDPILLQDPRGRQWYAEWVGDLTESPFAVDQPFYAIERGWVETDVPS